MSDIVVGSLVKIARKPSEEELAKWPNSFTNHMETMVGNDVVYYVEEIRRAGVELSNAKTGDATGYGWPIESLVTYEQDGTIPRPVVVGDFVKCDAVSGDSSTIYEILSASGSLLTIQPVQVSSKQTSPLSQNLIVRRGSLTQTRKPNRYEKNKAKNIRPNDMCKVGDNFFLVQNLTSNGMGAVGELFVGRSVYGASFILDQLQVVVRDVVIRRSQTERAKILAKFKANLLPPTTQQRTITNKLDKRFKAMGTTLGVVLATPPEKIDRRDIVDVMNQARDLLSWFALEAISDKMYRVHQREMEEITRCDDCGAYECRDDMEYVEGDRICRACIDDHYQWSDLMEMYINSDSCYRYFETESDYLNDEFEYITYDYADRNGLYARNGAYFSEEAYYDLGYEDEGDDDDYESRNGLRGYHSSSRRFVEQGGTKVHPPLGVEIEVYSEDRRDSVSALRKIYKHTELYLESDGSLDDEYGFEIITQPYGKELWKTHSSQILGALIKTGAVAFNHPDENNRYGIHININRQHLSPLQEARMFMMLAADENQKFVQAIAQRLNIYSPRVDIGSTPKRNQRINHMGGLENRRHKGKTVKKVMGAGKYCPINFHGDIAEIRIFQSTLLETSFNKNLEFVWALVEWTSPTSATGSSWNHVDFLKWLSTRQQVEKDYPNLMAYLRKPKYAVKFSGSPVRSTWAELVRPAVRSSVVIETDELLKEAA
jgi:hypothetical protein